MDEHKILEEVKSALGEALDDRRGLVAFSRLEALEMDRRAREVEREALEQIRKVLPATPSDPQLRQVQTRLGRMDEALKMLAQRQNIPERSRALERDDIIWRTFEDLSWLLGGG